MQKRWSVTLDKADNVSERLHAFIPGRRTVQSGSGLCRRLHQPGEDLVDMDMIRNERRLWWKLPYAVGRG
jgi:hypothetical protein